MDSSDGLATVDAVCQASGVGAKVGGTVSLSQLRFKAGFHQSKH